MIIGLGCDIVNIERLFKSAKFLQDFKTRILGDNELSELKHQIIDDDKKLVSIMRIFYAKRDYVKLI